MGRVSQHESVKKTIFLATVALLVNIPATAQRTAQRSPESAAPGTAAPSAAAERALLDQYCVTCHNDKTKTANFSLQREDINTVGDHPEVWERVIRKLRAGMMPPPGMPRPQLAKYEELRDWLEAQIDQKAT